MKYELKKTGETFQGTPIPKWKWARIAKDFVVGLPMTLRKYDSMLLIIDRLTNFSHFIPM